MYNHFRVQEEPQHNHICEYHHKKVIMYWEAGNLMGQQM
jgi:hypothetical protein